MDEAFVTAAPSASAPVASSSPSTVHASSQQAQQPQRPLQQRPRVVPRDRFNHQSLGPSLNAAVKQARVLMVGAGGIGCELLKDLVLTGFGEIHVVDLDTIDLSNLNRQFLFRHEHIKKSKALVAKEAAQKFNPGASIVAYHANIKDAQFNVAWFRRFNMVYNALDNLDARRHVNRMCLAADVPLIESGTTGFNGQVQVIKKGVTACYDCSPKETPKTFPVCTIRSTPSQPIHCIVWAKSYLLNEMFGASEDASAFDDSTTVDNAQEIEELKREAAELKEIRAAVGTDAFPLMLFDKVFGKDIERLRSVEDMWKSRRPPEALTFDAVMLRASDALASKERILADDQAVWSLEESLIVFIDSLQRLSKRMLHLTKSNEESSAPEPAISFDKDDQDTLDFVASSANIRSTVFGIHRKSRFEIKQMAGNIIPAIATTNAIVAGVCVLESFKVLRGDFGQSKEIFLTPFAPARLLAPNPSRKPKPDCPVCGVFNASIMVDLGRATLSNVVQDVVRGELGFGDKEFSVSNDVGILYDVDETDNLSKKLSELGVDNGTLLTVVDDGDENPLVNVVLDVEERPTDDEEKPVRLTLAERPNIPQKPTAPESNGDVQQNGARDAAPKGVKRGHSEDDRPPTKKAKTADLDVVVVDDSGGVILIADD
ncbi:Ubiquitin-activating enzyme E1-like protein [Ophiocordyceps camponoti-floridani]|uniref:Ubiquitin-activating enzyme E1-like n=1 Tax=Ophiocordyceps camponoti-floridani TaxID=2030778 RepID=A0A8H4Q3X9_9HYPO|nr:Ubiquitin-activating enzyme E1-like protein [Ophiocordyceps camponoti-floridani]